MGIKRHKPEEIVTKLRQVEVLCGHRSGEPVVFWDRTGPHNVVCRLALLTRSV